MNPHTLIPGTWADDGLCNGHPCPDDWHPSTTGRLAPHHRLAVAICRQCPVQTQCLTWALEHGEAGIWGATTERERRLLRRKPPGRRGSCGTASGYQLHVSANERPCEECRIAHRGHVARVRAEARAAR